MNLLEVLIQLFHHFVKFRPVLFIEIGKPVPEFFRGREGLFAISGGSFQCSEPYELPFAQRGCGHAAGRNDHGGGCGASGSVGRAIEILG